MRKERELAENVWHYVNTAVDNGCSGRSLGCGFDGE
jgi:hypothetical protein